MYKADTLPKKKYKWTIILICFSVEIRHHDQEQLLEEGVSLLFLLVAHQLGKSGQELKAETWRNVDYWLASSDLISYFSSTAQAHLPRYGSTHSGLGPSISISH